MDVLALANRIPTIIFGSKSDDDLSDRLNYRYTVALLVIFSVIITTRQFGSEVIKCWVPAHFTSNYEQYASQICWISNTYYTAPNEHIPKDEIERRKNEIKYYQWVSFILLFQALMFYAPRIFWRTFSVRSGIDICDLVEAAYNYKSAENYEKRDKYMEYLVNNIDQYVDDIRRYENKRPRNVFLRFIGCLLPCTGKYLGNYIVILYFVVKFVYILNTILQAFILGAILGKSFYRFGIELIEQLISGQGWIIESKYFPKVTLCDFHIREMGHPNKSHRYTIQCVLPINLFNQQIFIFLWFWYLIVIVWNVVSLVIWLNRSLTFRSDRWIKRRVYLFNDVLKENERKLNRPSKKFENFVRRYLEPDGFFILRMIGNNSSDFVASDLIKYLWIKHYQEYKDRHLFDDEPQNEQTGVDLPIINQNTHTNSTPFPYNNNNSNNSNNNNNMDTNDLRNRLKTPQTITSQFKLNNNNNNNNGDYYGVDQQLLQNLINNESSIVNNNNNNNDMIYTSRNTNNKHDNINV